MSKLIEYITNDGYRLLARSLTGECTIDFTKVQMGDGNAASSGDLRRATRLSHVCVEIPVDTTEIESDNTIVIAATFSNEELTTGFYYREKGVWASDGTNEILFSYAYNSEGTWIPPFTEEIIEKRIKSICTQIQDVDTPISIRVKSGIYATTEELEVVSGRLTELLAALKQVAYSASYNDLLDTPPLGTAAAKDIAESGNAGNNQVVMGNDSRLSDSRPASDVYDWAKQPTKPAYNKSEVGLGNVDNTSDVNKPISEAVQNALDEKQNTSSALTLGETSSKAYRGDRGKAAYDHSQSAHLGLGETSSTAYRGDRGKAAYNHSISDHGGVTPAFTQATSRANISTGETLKVMLGKIAKFFADLGTAAFMNTGTTSSTVALGNHTHNYAGSSSAGGAATSANKINTNAGSGTTPVYFANGVPVACTYSLNKSVPSNAVFTDTNTWRGITDTYTSDGGSATSLSAKGAYNMYSELNNNLNNKLSNQYDMLLYNYVFGQNAWSSIVTLQDGRKFSDYKFIIWGYAFADYVGYGPSSVVPYDLFIKSSTAHPIPIQEAGVTGSFTIMIAYQNDTGIRTYQSVSPGTTACRLYMYGIK